MTPCLLGMEFLYNFDCILNPEKTNCSVEKLGKLNSCPHHNEVTETCFLVAAEDHDLPCRCEVFIKCSIVDEEGNKAQQIEIIVEPLKDLKTNHIY